MTVGFIGTGNMGGALARAAHKSGAQVLLANRTPDKAQMLCQALPGARVATNDEIASACQFIYLGVKPQMMAGLLAQIAPVLAGRTDPFVLVSMAAGLELDTLAHMAGGSYPLIRILPNTPAAIGQGVAQFCLRDVTSEQKAAFLTQMAPSGRLDEMDEGQMTAANCISGCGVAFVAMFMEALADGAVACGLPRDKALACAAQTLVGTGALYLEQGVHPGAMKDAVCSPGGTTIQGVRTLEQRGLRAAAVEAVIAAYEKTKALSKG